MKNRHDIKAFVLKIENDFPVDEWSIDNIDIWPILRVKFFLILVSSLENSNTKDKYKPVEVKKKYFIIEKLNSLLNVDKKRAKAKLNKLTKVDFLFGSAFIYRSNYREESFMKFADPLMDFSEKKSLAIEHSPLHYYDRENIYKKDRVAFLYELLDYTLLSKSRKKRLLRDKDFNLPDYDKFLSLISTKDEFSEKKDQFNFNALKYLINRFHDFEDIYTEIINITQPKVVFTICHYSFQSVVLNYVANKKSIKTIEIQHGPQSEVHLGYASWSKLPENGFNTLPKVFWNWDNYSYNEMSKWANFDKQHSCFVGGNPWVDLLKSNNNVEKTIVLYSLQNLHFDHLFPDYIIEQIKSTKNYDWWLRLHPRQTEYLDELVVFFKTKGIDHLVNIKEATELPLPEILNRTKIHITNFSGCTLESASYEVPTIIIDERGFDAFKDIIMEKKAFYITTSNEFAEVFNKLIKRNITNTNDLKITNFKDIMKSLTN